jgi:class 3 adenylate cyclase
MTEPVTSERPAENAVDAGADMRNLLAAWHQIRRFVPFLASAGVPSIRDVEVLAVFADVRGFSEYCRKQQEQMQDRTIQNFLRAHAEIYLEGLFAAFVTANRTLEPEERGRVLEHLSPTLYKNLGDGVMLIWEIPGSLEPALQSKLVATVLDALDKIRQRFYGHFRGRVPGAIEAFGPPVENLDIGFGVAKGHAWRLDYPSSIDYAGSIVNLAARLQDKARPSGLVVQKDVATWVLQSRVLKGEGAFRTVRGLRGYDSVGVWISNDVDRDQQGSMTEPPEGARDGRA